jgi:hypothetical protein
VCSEKPQRKQLRNLRGRKIHSHLSPLNQTKKKKFSKALIVFGELLYFVWKVIEGVFYCSLIYVGQEYNPSLYGFRFTLKAINRIETISECMKTLNYF